jgi:hypothetical protein
MVIQTYKNKKANISMMKQRKINTNKYLKTFLTNLKTQNQSKLFSICMNILVMPINNNGLKLSIKKFTNDFASPSS